MFKLLALTFIAALIAACTSDESAPFEEIPTFDPAAPEPITGTAVMPNVENKTPPPHRFAPYDPGPPEHLWRYEDLTAEEKKVVDEGRDTTGWEQVHVAYRSAIAERLPAIRAQAAASQVGICDVARLGVVR